MVGHMDYDEKNHNWGFVVTHTVTKSCFRIIKFIKAMTEN